MKRIAFLAALALVGCMPTVNNKPALEGQRSGELVYLVARLEGRLTIGSSLPIKNTPVGCQLTSTIANGANTGLLCFAPIEIRFRTLGAVSANIVKNGQPLTPFVFVERF